MHLNSCRQFNDIDSCSGKVAVRNPSYEGLRRTQRRSFLTTRKFKLLSLGVLRRLSSVFCLSQSRLMRREADYVAYLGVLTEPID